MRSINNPAANTSSDSQGAVKSIVKMSKETAYQFLEAATQDLTLREKLTAAHDPDEFVRIAEGLGYSFTTQDLKDVVMENSENVTLRRKTGVWPWLRHVHWI